MYGGSLSGVDASMCDRRGTRAARLSSLPDSSKLRLRSIGFMIPLALGLLVIPGQVTRQRSALAGEVAKSGARIGEADGPAGSWRQVHSPGPGGLSTTSALLRTAELERSDPRLAGLMLRCNGHDVDAILVIVEPFPPRAQPRITLRAGNHESSFSGTLIPTGVGIRLPVDGISLAIGPWRAAKELEVRIVEGSTVIEGFVGLSGLSTAITALSADCAQK